MELKANKALQLTSELEWNSENGKIKSLTDLEESTFGREDRDVTIIAASASSAHYSKILEPFFSPIFFNRFCDSY